MRPRPERKPKRSGQKVKPQIGKDDKAAPRASQAKPADDDEPPQDMDEFRNAMARRINMLIDNRKGYWRGCKERACFAPRIECSNAPPLPPQTPEDWGRLSAQIQRALREVMAQRGAAEE